MRIGFALFFLVAAAIFVIIPKVTGNSQDRITVAAEKADEKKALEGEAQETVAYFTKYKENLKADIKIVAVNSSASYSTLVNKYKLSESQAATVSSGRGFYTNNTIFINTQMAAGSIVQKATVAHELTHHYQKQLAKTEYSLLWLQEGMADVTAGNVLEDTGQSAPQLISVARLNLPTQLTLSQLRSDADWLQAAGQYGAEAVYIYSSMAVRELVDRNGYGSLIAFHHELGRTQDIEKSFKSAFRVELEEFEKKFTQRVNNPKSQLEYRKFY